MLIVVTGATGFDARQRTAHPHSRGHHVSALAHGVRATSFGRERSELAQERWS